MKLILTAALLLAAPAAFAQNAPAPTPAPAADAAAPASAAKFNLDTPLETLVADPGAKAVLTTDFGGMDVTTLPMYDSIKTMSLSALGQMAPDKLPPELLKKVEADLAPLK